MKTLAHCILFLFLSIPLFLVGVCFAYIKCGFMAGMETGDKLIDELSDPTKKRKP